MGEEVSFEFSIGMVAAIDLALAPGGGGSLSFQYWDGEGWVPFEAAVRFAIVPWDGGSRLRFLDVEEELDV